MKTDFTVGMRLFHPDLKLKLPKPGDFTDQCKTL